MKSEADDEHLERCVAAGLVRRGTGDLSWLLAEPPLQLPGADLAKALDDDREDRVVLTWPG